jgi:hypothetical protein
MGERNGAYTVQLDNLGKAVHLESLEVDTIILRWIFQKWDKDLTDLAQNWNRWLTLVNGVMDLRIP